MAKRTENSEPTYARGQVWSLKEKRPEFKNQAQILRCEEGNLFRVSVDFSAKGKDVYDYDAVIVTVDDTGLVSSLQRLKSKASPLPYWLVEPEGDFASTGNAHFVDHITPTIGSGLQAALDALLDMPTTIRGGMQDRVEALLSGDPDMINRPLGVDAETPLMFAARENQPKILECLIQHGANTEARDQRGRTALHLCVELQSQRTLKALLAHGVNPNTRDNTGVSPLYIAAATSDLPLQKLLLKHGAEIDLRSAFYLESSETVLERLNELTMAEREDLPKQDLLFDAIRIASVALTRKLLELGADANDRGLSGLSPLEQAKLNPALLEVLLEFGADPNTRTYNGNPLIISLAKRDPTHPSIEILLEAGATHDLLVVLYLLGPEDVIAQLQSSSSPLAEEESCQLMSHAICKESIELLEELLAHGVDPNLRLPDGQSPLRACVFAAKNTSSQSPKKVYLRMVELLLAHKANPNPQDDHSGLSLLAQAKGKSMWLTGTGEKATSLELPDATGDAIAKLLIQHGAIADDFTPQDEAKIARLKETQPQ